MKVLHVEAGKHLYGGAQQVLYIMQGLSRLGVDNVLACPPGSDISVQARQYARVVPVTMGGDADLLMITRLYKLVRQERPDIVHLHSRRGADVFGGVAAKLASVPCVLSRRVDNRESVWWVKQKYKLYDRVITISEAIKSVLLNEGVAEHQLTCVRSAVDAQLYDRICNRESFYRHFNIRENQVVIAMMAQFIPRKGHHYLLEALPGIISSYPHCQVLLFGKGPLLEEVRQRVNDLQLQEHVTLTGFRTDLDQWLCCIDILVHPAEKEGLGVSLLQASAAGVPIVGARAGGIPEVVEHQQTGLLVDVGDVDALASSIKQLLAEPELRKEMSVRAKSRMHELFSIEVMAQGNLDVYREVLSR